MPVFSKATRHTKMSGRIFQHRGGGRGGGERNVFYQRKQMVGRGVGGSEVGGAPTGGGEGTDFLPHTRGGGGGRRGWRRGGWGGAGRPSSSAAVGVVREREGEKMREIETPKNVSEQRWDCLRILIVTIGDEVALIPQQIQRLASEAENALLRWREEAAAEEKGKQQKRQQQQRQQSQQQEQQQQQCEGSVNASSEQQRSGASDSAYAAGATAANAGGPPRPSEGERVNIGHGNNPQEGATATTTAAGASDARGPASSEATGAATAEAATGGGRGGGGAEKGILQHGGQEHATMVRVKQEPQDNEEEGGEQQRKKKQQQQLLQRQQQQPSHNSSIATERSLIKTEDDGSFLSGTTPPFAGRSSIYEGAAAAISTTLLLPHEKKLAELIVACASQLPLKIGIYASLLGLWYKKSRMRPVCYKVVQSSLLLLEDSLKKGDFSKVTLLLRFFIALASSSVLRVESVFDLLKNLLSLASAVPAGATTEHLLLSTLSSLPWISVRLYELQRNTMDAVVALAHEAAAAAAGSSAEQLLLQQATLPIRVPPSPAAAAVSDSSTSLHSEAAASLASLGLHQTRLDSLLDALASMVEGGWRSRATLRFYQSADLYPLLRPSAAAATPCTLPSISLRAQDILAVKVSPLQRVLRLPVSIEKIDLPLASHDRWILEDYILTIFRNFRKNVALCAEQLLRVPVEHEQFEYVLVECLFSELFQLPHAPLIEDVAGSSFLVARVLHRASQLQNSLVAVVEAVLTSLVRHAAYFDYNTTRVLADFFAYWLNAWGGPSRLLEEWLGLSIPPACVKSFVRLALEKAFRLRYRDELISLLPGCVEPYWPPNPLPECPYTAHRGDAKEQQQQQTPAVAEDGGSVGGPTAAATKAATDSSSFYIAGMYEYQSLRDMLLFSFDQVCVPILLRNQQQQHSTVGGNSSSSSSSHSTTTSSSTSTSTSTPTLSKKQQHIVGRQNKEGAAAVVVQQPPPRLSEASITTSSSNSAACASSSNKNNEEEEMADVSQTEAGQPSSSSPHQHHHQQQHHLSESNTSQQKQQQQHEGGESSGDPTGGRSRNEKDVVGGVVGGGGEVATDTSSLSAGTSDSLSNTTTPTTTTTTPTTTTTTEAAVAGGNKEEKGDIESAAAVGGDPSSPERRRRGKEGAKGGGEEGANSAAAAGGDAMHADNSNVLSSADTVQGGETRQPTKEASVDNNNNNSGHGGLTREDHTVNITSHEAIQEERKEGATTSTTNSTSSSTSPTVSNSSNSNSSSSVDGGGCADGGEAKNKDGGVGAAVVGGVRTPPQGEGAAAEGDMVVEEQEAIRAAGDEAAAITEQATRYHYREVAAFLQERMGKKPWRKYKGGGGHVSTLSGKDQAVVVQQQHEEEEEAAAGAGTAAGAGGGAGVGAGGKGGRGEALGMQEEKEMDLEDTDVSVRVEAAASEIEEENLDSVSVRERGTANRARREKTNVGGGGVVVVEERRRGSCEWSAATLAEVFVYALLSKGVKTLTHTDRLLENYSPVLRFLAAGATDSALPGLLQAPAKGRRKQRSRTNGARSRSAEEEKGEEEKEKQETRAATASTTITTGGTRTRDLSNTRHTAEEENEKEKGGATRQNSHAKRISTPTTTHHNTSGTVEAGGGGVEDATMEEEKDEEKEKEERETTLRSPYNNDLKDTDTTAAVERAILQTIFKYWRHSSQKTVLTVQQFHMRGIVEKETIVRFLFETLSPEERDDSRTMEILEKVLQLAIDEARTKNRTAVPEKTRHPLEEDMPEAPAPEGASANERPHGGEEHQDGRQRRDADIAAANKATAAAENLIHMVLQYMMRELLKEEQPVRRGTLQARLLYISRDYASHINVSNLHAQLSDILCPEVEQFLAVTYQVQQHYHFLHSDNVNGTEDAIGGSDAIFHSDDSAASLRAAEAQQQPQHASAAGDDGLAVTSHSHGAHERDERFSAAPVLAS